MKRIVKIEVSKKKINFGLYTNNDYAQFQNEYVMYLEKGFGYQDVTNKGLIVSVMYFLRSLQTIHLYGQSKLTIKKQQDLSGLRDNQTEQNFEKFIRENKKRPRKLYYDD